MLIFFFKLLIFPNNNITTCLRLHRHMLECILPVVWRNNLRSTLTNDALDIATFLTW